jgi:hypothetical protein
VLPAYALVGLAEQLGVRLDAPAADRGTAILGVDHQVRLPAAGGWTAAERAARFGTIGHSDILSYAPRAHRTTIGRVGGGDIDVTCRLTDCPPHQVNVGRS